MQFGGAGFETGVAERALIGLILLLHCLLSRSFVAFPLFLSAQCIEE